MACVGVQVTVTTAATLLGDGTNGTAQSPVSVVVSNPTGATVYLGGAGVTASGGAQGYALAANQSVSVDLWGGDILYGIVASGTQVISVLRTRS